MLAYELSPVEQQLRQPGQRTAAALIDAGEARNHVAHQEQGHATTDDQQDHRVDEGADHLVAYRLQARLVVEVARQRARQIAGSLGSADDADIERWEDVGLAGQRRRKTQTLAQVARQALEHRPRTRRRLFFEQRLEGLDQAQSGFQQSQ
ncbi:MAG: hypothetical protein AW09_004496 [Candidatus Accumulibacter phosphatis]|uniref:Uncharacterized protein n=1 Tax=Candidatus Accumulibacter phosphatis TaxID=327160 RepID=A0A084Y6Q6_9PROT|nr:MAG: hypothetical protein AW09_004496 [Candidatus Accumulibacter phosphatis]